MLFFIILITSNLYNCKMNNNMIIKPIDKELNEGFLTGKGLYSNLFNTTGVIQYYTIKNYDTTDFIPKIEQFIIKQYKYEDIIKTKQVIISLYKERFLGYSRRSLYESARDNEFGGIEGFDEYFIFKIILENTHNSSKEVTMSVIHYDEVESKHTKILTLK